MSTLRTISGQLATPSHGLADCFRQRSTDSRRFYVKRSREARCYKPCQMGNTQIVLFPTVFEGFQSYLSFLVFKCILLCFCMIPVSCNFVDFLNIIHSYCFSILYFIIKSSLLNYIKVTSLYKFQLKDIKIIQYEHQHIS